MWLQAGRLLTCLLVTCVCVCRGLDLTFDRTPENRFCAQLLCDEGVSQSDEHISYLIGLSIYNVTLAQPAVKLASVSLFEDGLYIDPSKFNVINGTGSISSGQGHLALSFQDVADCLHGTFLCQLDFVAVSSQPGTITQSTISGDSGHCSLHEKLLAARIDNLTTENKALESKVSQLQTRLESATQRIAVLQAQVSGSTCYKGMLSNTSRQEFLLWGRVPALCDTETDGGGWIVIQRRTKGDVDFYRGWADYKNGFGTPDTDYWIGLDVIHNLTSQSKSSEVNVPIHVRIVLERMMAPGAAMDRSEIVRELHCWTLTSNYCSQIHSKPTRPQLSQRTNERTFQRGYNEIRFDLQYNGTNYFESYSDFTVADELSKYRLSVGEFNGTAGDAFTYHSDEMFSTYDSDNDVWPGNCASDNHGAWWYAGCYWSNLNGQWAEDNSTGVIWYNLTRAGSTEMKVRQVADGFITQTPG
ncbi:hypothetical protein BsWGS_06967 [Bradybaena similaris]